MANVMVLYMDDSGTRQPDRHPDDRLPNHGYDWFGLGGILVREDEEFEVRQAHRHVCEKWKFSAPLHSAEIRAKSHNFRWLRRLSAEALATFYADLAVLVTDSTLTAIACVVDRPGYNARYRQQYGRKRWSLCKTAFSVLVERSAKFARRSNCRLRVNVERSDKKTDNRFRRYYEELRISGQPFNPTNSAKYGPLTAEQMRETLLEFRPKFKTSPLVQIADLCLWPMCIGGYHPQNRSFAALQQAGTLIDCKLSANEIPTQGTKYSCWELVHQKPKPGESRASGQPPTG